MTDSPAKPRGRRPGRADTRGTICRAALTLFSTIGYDKVSLRAIAAELNARGIRTRRGGQWGVSNAKALVGRLAR